MAFQTGTKVDPRLLNVDYSPLIRAGEMQAQALANLGEQVGGAIKKYQADKQKKKDQEDLYNAILPYAQDYAGDQEEAEDMARTFSRDPKVGSQILQFAGIQKEQNAQAQAIAVNTLPGGEVDWERVPSSYMEFGGKNISDFSKAIQTAKGPGEIEVDPETGIISQDGSYKGVARKSPGDPKAPAGVREAEAQQEALAQARELYTAGDINAAQDILTSWGVLDVAGLPATASGYFGGEDVARKVKDDPLGLNL
jgi:hypothetical protein